MFDFEHGAIDELVEIRCDPAVFFGMRRGSYFQTRRGCRYEVFPRLTSVLNLWLRLRGRFASSACVYKALPATATLRLDSLCMSGGSWQYAAWSWSLPHVRPSLHMGHFTSSRCAIKHNPPPHRADAPIAEPKPTNQQLELTACNKNKVRMAIFSPRSAWRTP